MGYIRALKFLLKDFGEIPYISIVAFSSQADLCVKVNTPLIYWNQILRVISQFGTPVLSNQQVQGICRTLRTINQSEDKEANRRHISNVRQNEIKRDAAVSSGHCPKCGGSSDSSAWEIRQLLRVFELPEMQVHHDLLVTRLF